MRLRLTEAAEQDLADIAAWLTMEASETTARRIEVLNHGVRHAREIGKETDMSITVRI